MAMGVFLKLESPSVKNIRAYRDITFYDTTDCVRPDVFS